MVPSYLTDKFIRTSSVREYNLRGANHKFFVPRPLSEYRKKSFSYRGAILWNNMPVQISSAQSLSEFMSLQCVSHLVNSYIVCIYSYK